MKNYLKKTIIIAVCITILAFAYLWGGDSPSVSYQDADKQKTETIVAETVENKEITPTPETEVISVPEKEVKEEIPPKEETEIPKVQNICTLSVKCDTILENIEWFDKDKIDILPQDGVIYPQQTVSFKDGESVFDVLLREMVKNKIHFEYMDNPLYKTAYIEGIGNIYEFDCGELSGWMYKVNGKYPGYGSSRHIVKNGDKIEWIYTCDLGKDTGGERFKETE